MASKFEIPSQIVYIFLGGCAVAFALFYISAHKKPALIALFLFCVGLGAFRLQSSIKPGEFAGLIGEKHQLEAYIVEDVDVRSSTQLITVKPKGFDQNILITTTLAQKFFYGDWIVVEGKVEEAKVFDDFDYPKYLERHNVYAVMRYPKLLILKSHQQNIAKEFLLKTKAAFVKRISGFLNEPQSSLLQGILIGAKKGLPQNIIDNFNATGTSHIIAVSGFNITIIVLALASLAHLVGRRASFWLASCSIIAFVIITGASASVLRAALMGMLLLVAFNIGRQYSITPALFFAALLMLAVNPKILFWDIGFQLSFAATLGIIYFFPVLDKLAESWPQIFGIKILFLTTISAIVATLPIILFNFGTLSLFAPFVNILILPFVPITMLMGFLSVLPFIGVGFAWLANIFLIYILKITEIFANFPYSNMNIKISVWAFWMLIFAVFALFLGLKRVALRLNKSRAYDKLI